jgi:nicotinamide-nucleotide amidase
MASSYRPSPPCAVLLVGSELLDGRVGDLNLRLLSRILSDRGITVLESRAVPDSADRISEAVAELASRYSLVVVTGGLGPTCDDVTVEATAAAVRRPLESSPEAEQMLKEKYRSWGSGVPPSVLRQALIPRGALPVSNPTGTAPGVVISGEAGCGHIILLPGFPSEAVPLLPLCLGALGLQGCDPSAGRRVLRLWGVPESTLIEGVPGLQEPEGTEVSILPSYGRLDIVLKGASADRLESEIKERFGLRIYSTSLDISLEETIGGLLAGRGLKLSLAESCTGGLAAKLLTDAPGASAWFLGGVTAYSDSVKTALLRVPGELLEKHGAVSSECATAMVLGVRRLTGSDVAGAVTGIAGPGGATPEKPVGTVSLAVSGPGDRLVTEDRRFRGVRGAIRSAAAAWLLGMIHGTLVEGEIP